MQEDMAYKKRDRSNASANETVWIPQTILISIQKMQKCLMFHMIKKIFRLFEEIMIFAV